MKKIIIAGLTGIVILLTVRFLFGGPEDSWICDKGQWVKHGSPSYPKPVVDCGKPVTLPKTKKECIKIGGVWEKQGPDPVETCDRRARDSGALCRDNSECEGNCQVELTREEMSTGMRGKLNKRAEYGRCSDWVVSLGCQGIMENGKVKVYCID